MKSLIVLLFALVALGSVSCTHEPIENEMDSVVTDVNQKLEIEASTGNTGTGNDDPEK
ncbi:hypothetical protein [Flagellimonas myxillae]|uniref:hypothetical protein n=1 Tax=Flagellimonas myxillae TaxID=2942214 RepID=UPI00201F11C6|nr:hypothetical protein [Muricauda myxillae]MCL6265050.1 hypothetical protein [Muricauda myxillae]